MTAAANVVSFAGVRERLETIKMIEDEITARKDAVIAHVNLPEAEFSALLDRERRYIEGLERQLDALRTVNDAPPLSGGNGGYAVDWDAHDERRQRKREHPEGDPAQTKPPEPLRFTDITAWQNQPVPPQEWLAFRRIPHENVTLLSGDGATGKTTIGLQLCIAVTVGKDWLGSIVERVGSVLFYTAEESEKELHRRLAAILAHYDLSYGDIAGKFFPHCRPDADAILAMPDRNGIVRPTPAFAQLQQAVLDVKPQLVFLEAASDLFGGDENKRPQVRGFLALLRGQLTMKCETAVVLLQHPSQAGLASGSGTSGSTQWNNSARSRLYLSTVKTKGEEGEPDRDLRKLEVMKANFGPTGEIIKLRWREGVFIVEPGKGTLEQLAAEAEIDRLFIKLLRQFTEQGRNVTDKTGTSYAPAQFAKQPEAKTAKVTSKDFADAMERLFTAKKIQVLTEGPPSHPRTRLVEASTDPSTAPSTALPPLPPGGVYRPPITPPPGGTGQGAVESAARSTGPKGKKGKRAHAGRKVTLWGVTFHVLGDAPAGKACAYCASAEPDASGGVKIIDGVGNLHEACAPAFIQHRDKAT